MPLREMREGPGCLRMETMNLPAELPLCSHLMPANALDSDRRWVRVLQPLAPEILRRFLILLLEPLNVFHIWPGFRQLHSSSVAICVVIAQYFRPNCSNRPAVEHNMMVAPNEIEAPWCNSNHRQSHQRRMIEGKTPSSVLCQVLRQ